MKDFFIINLNKGGLLIKLKIANGFKHKWSQNKKLTSLSKKECIMSRVKLNHQNKRRSNRVISKLLNQVLKENLLFMEVNLYHLQKILSHLLAQSHQPPSISPTGQLTWSKRHFWTACMMKIMLIILLKKSIKPH